jgi:phospholipase C
VDNTVPAAGYTWTTYPERLQAAGVSWKYCVANPLGTDLGWFTRYINAQPGDPLHDNAMVPYSPSMVADMDALGATPEVWAKTVFIINYDENDGRFDHVPPPTAPQGTPGEWVTASPLPPGAAGIAGPVGLGFRVPAMVISPYSRGGWVCGEAFDHTSTLRFLERRFGVMEPNISAWRRSAVGDMTSALRLGEHDMKMPSLPNPAALLALQQQEAATLPAPAVPGAAQQVPHQEPGCRPHTL